MNFDIRIYTEFQQEQILNLYESVGWIAYTKDPDSLQRAFANSLLTLAVYAEDQLIGIVRTVGDGESIIFIQDLLVHPEYQRKGIGSALIREVLNRYPHVRQIQLTTDTSPDTIAFYTSLGFHALNDFKCTGFIAPLSR